MNKDKISQYCLYFWLLVWPWQTKLIIHSAPVNYLEISFFISWLLLFIPFLVWGWRFFLSDYWRFKKNDKYPLWWLGLILLELVAFLSIFWAEDKILALFRYLVLVIGILLFYIIKNNKIIFIHRLGNFFLLGLFIPALLGVWQFFSQNTATSKYLGLAFHSSSLLGSSVIETSSGRFLRAYGSFDHPNILGGLMALALIIIIYLSLKKEISKNQRLFYLISFILFYLTLLLSFSRSAILAFFVSLFFILINAWRGSLVQKKIIYLFITLMICVSVVVIMPNRELFFVRVNVNSRLEQKSLIERESYIRQAADIIIKNPIQGVGLGNYILAEKKTDNSRHELWYYQPVHNYWLLIWSEIGLFGLLGIFIFWFSIIKLSIKKYLWPLAITLFILSLFDHWFWTQPMGLMVFFLLAAFMVREDF